MRREDFDREVKRVREPDPAHACIRALGRLRAAALEGDGEAFPWVAEYKALLHDLTTSADLALRRAAISELAIQKDPIVQQQLRDALLSDAPPLLPPAVALQLLSYDPHGDFVDLCRRFVEGAHEEHLRIEAIRGLASDHTAAERLARLMTDPAEPRAIRFWSGLSLRALAPPRFARVASELLMMPPDDTSIDVRVMCEVALRTSPTLKSYL